MKLTTELCWCTVIMKVIENPVHSGNSTQLLAVICMQLEGCYLGLSHKSETERVTGRTARGL